MQPLNIFVVHASDQLTDHLPNGAGWLVFNYLRGLAERGHTVHVATPCAEVRAAVPPGMHVHVIPRRWSSGLLNRCAYMLAVRRLFNSLSRTLHFDVAQQFTPVNTGLSLCMLGTRVPLILGPYSGHWAPEAFGQPKRTAIISRVKRRVRDQLAAFQQSRASALIITCPDAIKRVLSKSLRRTRTHVISHGVHSHDYLPRPAVPERRSILFLAVLEYWKGIFTLLDAFEQVAAEIPDCHLEVWGDGAQADSVRKRVAGSAFRGRIALRGRAPRDNVNSIMQSHSVYCLPSYGEPFGMSILEAMASGVPIVSTNAGGPAFLVNEHGGRVVPMREIAPLAAALKEILLNRNLQAAMGSYNRRRVEQEFDWSRSLDLMEAVYAQILDKRGRQAEIRAPGEASGILQ